MAGRKELGFPNRSTLREQMDRAALNRVWADGHTYVELRENGRGKPLIFFCTLCLSPCFSELVLRDHLRGSLHTGRLPTAKVTLLKSNPWPFNDGVFFFNNTTENEKQPATSSWKHNAFLDSPAEDNSLAVVEYCDNLHMAGCKGLDSNLNGDEENYDVVIPGVRIKDKICDLKVRFTGFAQIASRSNEKSDGSNEISRIWCEWLGNKDPSLKDTCKPPDHEFSIVTFANSYDLGREDLFENVRLLLTSQAESEDGEGSNRKKRKSFSDPEDVSESFKEYHSSPEVPLVANISSSRLSLDQYDDLLLNTRSTSNKSMRREVRRHQRVAAERTCYICQLQMLLGKDVATLVNTSTQKLACSSRNVNGAFHIFHVSCLLHWLLLCESDVIKNQSSVSKGRRASKRKNSKNGNDGLKGISSVLCPECQGTGVNLEGDILKLEEPRISLSQIYEYKMKAACGRNAWMKSPEVLENCTMGLHFPSESEQIEQMVEEVATPLKLLCFYRADQ